MARDLQQLLRDTAFEAPELDLDAVRRDARRRRRNVRSAGWTAGALVAVLVVVAAAALTGGPRAPVIGPAPPSVDGDPNLEDGRPRLSDRSQTLQRITVTGDLVTITLPEGLATGGWSSHAVLVAGPEVLEAACGELGFEHTQLQGLGIELADSEPVASGKLSIGTSGASTVAVWRGEVYVVTLFSDQMSIEDMKIVTDGVEFVETPHGAAVEPRPGSETYFATDDGVDVHQPLAGFGSLDIRMRTASNWTPEEEGTELEGGIYVAARASDTTDHALVNDTTVTYIQPLPQVPSSTVDQLIRRLRISWSEAS